MHPYVIERLVEERQEELRRLARVEVGARAAGQARHAEWRRSVGRALVAVAVAVGVPRSERRAAHCRVTTTLGFEPHC
jgi:hypothetical protein